MTREYFGVIGVARMDSIRTQIDTYLQKLLEMQFSASNQITHKLTKGESREKFIRQIVLGEFPKLILKKGLLCSGEWQSTQADFLWLNDNARIGNYDIYDLADCKLFMEVKSCAKASELCAIESTAMELKKRCSSEKQIRVGMFCYSTKAKEKTVLKNFGFLYDRDIKGYVEYKPNLDKMKHVDFLYSLNINCDNSLMPYFVIRDYLGNCTLYKKNPVIQYFFNLFR